MTDDQLIASQARTIAENDVTIADLTERLRSIHMMLICIGGPLNDNVLRYSREQLGPFWDIHEEADIA